MSPKPVKVAALALMALTGLLAALLVPVLFLVNALVWAHQTGMEAAQWAAQSLWPLTLVRGLALLGIDVPERM